MLNPPPIDPLLLFRSFLTVVSGFVLSQFAYLLIGLALGYLFFPEFIAFFQLDAAEQKRQLAENLGAVLPWSLFLAHLFVSSIALYFVGWLTASWSPFAAFQHGLFVAILIFVWFLQLMIADPPSKKLMDFIFMVTLPAAILFGASRASAILAAAAEEPDLPHE